MKRLILKYKQAWVFLYAFIYFPWFLYLEHHVTEDYYIIHSRLDDLIPFCEYFIIPYILWFAYMAGGMIYFLFFQPKKEFYKLTGFLFTGMTICLLICTIFPNGHNMRPVIDFDKNIFTRLVSFIYTADTNTNIFPSIHVFGTLGVHIALCECSITKKYPALKIISAILACAICLSTVFLKQHSCLDVFGGIVLASIMYLIIYMPKNFATGTQRSLKYRLNKN